MTKLDIPALLAELTLEEKASLCTGQDFWHSRAIERLGIPKMMLTDGPHGLRKQTGSSDHLGLNDSEPATCFPSAAGLGSTWDRELLSEIGEALGAETAAAGVGVLLGPGINLKRSPLCGRNFEYFSEDPYLTGQLAAPMVSGVQSHGVGTSLKHFAANNQETDRMRVNAQIDERTLREMYLRAFEHVVRESQPWTIMCSYNQINGTFASEDPWLLTSVLRDEWGFEGLVISDWGAVNDRADALAAGLDLEMPYSYGLGEKSVVEAVRRGKLSEEALDLAVTRVLTLIDRAHAAPAPFDVEAHHALARQAAAGAAVLLKNEGALPLAADAFDAGQTVIIGEFARTPRYQGAGSSQVHPTKLVSLLEALAERGINAPFAPGFHLPEAAGQPGQDEDAEALATQAVALATSRRVILTLGLPAAAESEGYDRDHMELPAEQVRLLERIAAVADQVVVLLSNGSAVTVAEWEHHADAVLELWLGGQAGGQATADLLLGDAAPSGRLAESIPVKLSHLPAQLNFPGENGEVRYGEGSFIGYRGLDAMQAPVSYPFGHGLTYTSFSYENLRAEAVEILDSTPADAPVVKVRLTIRNTGKRAGAAVPQIYLGRPESALARAPRELLGFDRIALEPGESATAEFLISRRQLSHWDVSTSQWVVEPGLARIEAGASSRDLPLRSELVVLAPPLEVVLHREMSIGDWLKHPTAGPAMLETLGEDAVLFDPNGPNPMSAGLLQALPVFKLPTMGLSRWLSLEIIDAMIAEHGK